MADVPEKDLPKIDDLMKEAYGTIENDVLLGGPDRLETDPYLSDDLPLPQSPSKIRSDKRRERSFKKKAQKRRKSRPKNKKGGKF